MDTDRRQGCALRFEPEAGVLVVGDRTAAVAGGPAAPDIVVGRYVELVVSQRAERPDSHVDLRNDELAALADLLALAPAELDERIDRELARLLGRVVTADAGGDRSRVWRRLVFAALLGTAVAAGAAWALGDDGDVTSTSGSDDEAPASEPAAAETPTTAAAAPAETTATTTAAPETTAPAPPPAQEPTVEIIDLPDGGTATRTESAPAPPGDGVDIGTAVVIERNETPPG